MLVEIDGNTMANILKARLKIDTTGHLLEDETTIKQKNSADRESMIKIQKVWS